jgi:hypothetical protein
MQVATVGVASLQSNHERVRLGFTRRVLQEDDRTLIQSTCNYCGVRIVGSAAESLAQDESDHLQKCLVAKRKAANH